MKPLAQSLFRRTFTKASCIPVPRNLPRRGRLCIGAYEVLEPRMMLYSGQEVEQEFKTLIESPLYRSVIVSALAAYSGDPTGSRVENEVTSLISHFAFPMSEGHEKTFDWSVSLGLQAEVASPVTIPLKFRVPLTNYTADLSRLSASLFSGYRLTHHQDMADPSKTSWTISRGIQLEIGNNSYAAEAYVNLSSPTDFLPNTKIDVGVRIYGDLQADRVKQSLKAALFSVSFGAEFEALSAKDYTFQLETTISVEKFLSRYMHISSGTLPDGLLKMFAPVISGSDSGTSGDSSLKRRLVSSFQFASQSIENLAFGPAEATTGMPTMRYAFGTLLQEGIQDNVSISVLEGMHLSASIGGSVGFGALADVGIAVSFGASFDSYNTLNKSQVSWGIGPVPEVTLQDVAEQMQGETFSGVTVLVHGFAGFGDDYMGEVATEGIFRVTNGVLLDVNNTRYGKSGFAKPRWFQNSGLSGNELVLDYDWVTDSVQLSSGWTDAAADNLFSQLSALHVVDPAHPTASLPIHFIGHSFGCAVISQTVRRLAAYQVPVDQVTYLDPHDFNQGRIFDTLQAQQYLAQPEGYGVAVWNNVAFCDVYYETRGFGDALSTFLIPVGRPIPGARNYLLQNGRELPNLRDNLFGELGGDHGFVLSFYIDTIIGQVLNGTPQPALFNAWDSTGYVFSRVAHGATKRHLDPMQFFSSATVGTVQSHAWTEPWIADRATGLPNQSGLAAHGMTAAQIESLQLPPMFDDMSIVNGDFLFGTSADNNPGWARHGADGYGVVEQDGTNNRYLVLRNTGSSKSHNGLMVPTAALGLQFKMRVVDASPDDELVVQLNGRVLGAVPLSHVDVGFHLGAMQIDESLRGKYGELSFAIRTNRGGVDSEVDIDDVQFVRQLPDLLPDAGGPYFLREGGRIELDASATTTGRFSTDTVQFLWDLDGDGKPGEIGFDAEAGDEVGEHPVLFARTSDDGLSAHPISLFIKADGLTSETVSAIVYVLDSPPVLSISGPAHLSTGQSAEYRVSAVDPSFQDNLNQHPGTWVWHAIGDDINEVWFGDHWTLTAHSDRPIEVTVDVQEGDTSTSIKRIINLPTAMAESVPPDGRIVSSLSDDGFGKLFTFSGQMQQLLNVSAYWGSSRVDHGSNSLSGFRLLDEDGTVLVQPANESVETSFPGSINYRDNRFSRLDNYRLLHSGTYYLQVIGVPSIGFQLAVDDPAVITQSLSKITRADATFRVRGERQDWTFSAVSGEALAWLYHGDARFNTWNVTDSTGSVVARDSGNDDTIAFTALRTDEYTLHLQAALPAIIRDESNLGPYSYSLSPAEVLPLNRAFDDRIDAPAFGKLFRFSGTADQAITLSAYWGYTSTHDGNDGGIHESAVFRIISPDGKVIKEPPIQAKLDGVGTYHEFDYRYSLIEDYRLPLTGDYLIEIVSARPGRFWLGATDPQPTVRTLSSASNTPLRIDVRGQKQRFVIEAQHDQSFAWTYAGSAPIGTWHVVDAAGVVVSSGAGGVITTISFTARRTGTYRLEFVDAVNKQIIDPGRIGPFDAELIPAIDAPLNQVIHGALNTQAAALYRVRGRSGLGFAVSAYWGYISRSFGADGGLHAAAELRVYDAHGNLLTTAPMRKLETAPEGTVNWRDYRYTTLDNLNFSNDEDYFVAVDGSLGSGGNYWMGISDPAEQFVDLPYSSSLQGQLPVRGDRLDFSFAGVANRPVGWRFDGLRLQSWSITDESGVVVAQSNASRLDRIAFTPTKSGNFFLRMQPIAEGTILSPDQIGPIPYVIRPSDVTPPTSHLQPLPRIANSSNIELSPVSVDLVGSNLVQPSGVRQFRVYVAVDQGPFELWQTVPATSSTIVYPAESNHIYWFYSVAIDGEGNIELKTPMCEAYTNVGDFTKPITQVINSTFDSNGKFTVEASGSDQGGAGLKSFNFYVRVDDVAPQLFAYGAAGTSLQGVHRATAVYQASADGASHRFVFYSIGTDFAGNIEPAPSDPASDILVTQRFSLPVNVPTGIDIQLGTKQRSYVRYADVLFGNPSSLQSIINDGRIRVEKFSLNATNVNPGSGQIVSGWQASAAPDRVRIDFGSSGIGAQPAGVAGNAFYRISIDSNSNGVFDNEHFEFFRLLGDANGDSIVNAVDSALATTQFGLRGSNLDADVNGDQSVHATDKALITREIGKSLAPNLLPFLDD